MGWPSPIGLCRGPRLMGLPKNMPHPAVGAIQTSLRKRVPSPMCLLRRVLPGGGPDWCPSGLHHSASLGQGRLSQPFAAQNPRTDPVAVADAGPAMEHCRESAPRRRRRDTPAVAAGSRPAFRPVSAALLILLRGYKLLISPMLPSACRFHPTCSCYMHEAIRTHGAGRGIYLGVRRLLKCHPWHPGGVDPVPAQPEPHRTELHVR